MKILAAMSGGVDSSAAAAMLIDQGQEVIGATLRLFESEGGQRDIEDAREVCRRLGIEHVVFDMRDTFREQIIGRFAEGYAAGITPNPCLDCNKIIKFGALLDEAGRLGCEAIATGHYARIEQNRDSGRFLLKRAKERAKDQSYVLYSLDQSALSRAVFPLGGLSKEQVRLFAKERGLAVSDKPDSQDICFVKDGDYAGFLRDRCGAVGLPGEFVDGEGIVVGRHRGHMHYTTGQRRGLRLALGRPVYVTGKDAKTNTVRVGEESELYRSMILVGQVNFIPFERPEGPMRVEAKIRYSQNTCPAELFWDGELARLLFETPQRAATPGQAAVFYDGEIVLGGGRII